MRPKGVKQKRGKGIDLGERLQAINVFGVKFDRV
jgi:hypothetical protein